MPAPGRILVLRGGAMGDLLVTRPALSALRRAFPCARLVLAARSEARELLREAGEVDEVRPLDHGPVAAGLRSAGAPDGWAACDLAVSLLPDPDGRAAAALRAGGAARVVAASPLAPAGHISGHLARALAEIGRADVPPVPDLRVAAGPRAAAAAWLRAAGIDGPYATLHPGSGGPAKNWPFDRYLDLASRLGARGWDVVLLLGEAERTLDGPPPRPGLAVARELPLGTVAALLAGGAAFVGNDSGVTHLAAAVGAPTLALFGPTDPAAWAPLGRAARVLRAPDGRLAGLATEAVLGALPALPARP